MTDAERARALSLLKAKDGKYVLDNRARRECPHCRGAGILMVTEWVPGPTIQHTEEPCPTCSGSGWLSTLVIEGACRERHNIEVISSSRCKACGVRQTDPPGTVTRPDTDQIIAVLEAAGYKVRYRTVDSHVYEAGWAIQPPNRLGWLISPDPDILVAACQALRSEEPCQPR